MPKSEAVPVAARKPGARGEAPIELICGALALALLVLAARIVATW